MHGPAGTLELHLNRQNRFKNYEGISKVAQLGFNKHRKEILKIYIQKNRIINNYLVVEEVAKMYF